MRTAGLALTLALLLPAAAGARPAAGPGPLATPTGLVRVATETYGCADPRTTLLLANVRDPHTHDPVWVEYMMARGQCVRITPYEPWRLVGRQGTLARISAARNAALSVPMFIHAGALAASFIDPPATAAPVPTVGPAPIPASPVRAPAPASAARVMPALATSAAPRRIGALELPPDNPGQAYANAALLREHETPWGFMLAGTLSLTGIAAAWMFSRRRLG